MVAGCAQSFMGWRKWFVTYRAYAFDVGTVDISRNP